MELLIILGGIQVMIWTSILLYRIAHNFIKKNKEIIEDESLPPYEESPPPYTLHDELVE